MDELREKIAQTLYDEWPSDGYFDKALGREMTDALLRAIEEAGYVVVPKKPTKAMLNDSSAPEVDRMIWSDMIAAAQLEEPRG